MERLLLTAWDINKWDVHNLHVNIYYVSWTAAKLTYYSNLSHNLMQIMLVKKYLMRLKMYINYNANVVKWWTLNFLPLLRYKVKIKILVHHYTATTLCNDLTYDNENKLLPHLYHFLFHRATKGPAIQLLPSAMSLKFWYPIWSLKDCLTFKHYTVRKGEKNSAVFVFV